MSRFGKLVRTAAVAAVSAVGAVSANAQSPVTIPAAPSAAAFAPLPDIAEVLTPESVLPAAHTGRAANRSNCPPAQCCPPGQVAPNYAPVPMGMTPNTGMGTGMGTGVPAVDDSAMFAGGRGRGAGAGPTSSQGGYIDNALPISHFRLRYDSAYGSNRPDRAEFFYAKCGCFGTPDARGPLLPETNVDYQEVTPYLEYALNERLSVFAGVPVRFINPTVNPNEAGIGDVYFGSKYAVVYNSNRVVTLQVRAIAPSGDERQGLGTGNWWVEPGVLYLEQLNPKWQFFGQFKGQIPVDPQSDFTGTVLTYGVGSSYVVCQGCWGYVAPVVEFVGWTVTDGKELADGQARSADGATIVNAKVGVRIGFGQPTNTFNISKSDLYIGYGRPLTGEVWYQDLIRVEYRRFF
jgi:hypothetical protein